ncbi:MAG TPA: xylulokinase [bacterium]|nr:xylulokinase [bacterium]
MGIDLGTTGVKVVITDTGGNTVKTASVEYPLLTPRPGWAEQDPSEWWKASQKAIRQALDSSGIKPVNIKCIGLTGQMHGAVFLDSRNRVLCPAILWCDQRTAEECIEINEKVGAGRIFEITANPVLTGFQSPKILWLRKNLPKLYRKVKKILLPKDYLRFLLTGAFATDVSDASGTSLLDIKKRKWSEEILRKLDIQSDFLPGCFESAEITGNITGKASLATGLKKDTPVVAGAGDQAAGGIGSGIAEEGLFSISLGTSGVVFAHSDKILADTGRRLHTFCHAVPNKWHLMGVMLSAGGSLRWLRDNIVNEPYEAMTSMAGKIKEGSEGLIFLPYLTGERCPYPDPAARGVFFGISLKHGREHFIRAVMEGITFGLKDSLNIMKKTGLSPGKKLRVSGGGARSPLWCQMMADIFNNCTVRLTCEEGPAYGAALIAGAGIGTYRDIVFACRLFIKEKDTFSPSKENAKKYEDFYGLYRKLYPSLKDRFDTLAKIV